MKTGKEIFESLEEIYKSSIIKDFDEMTTEEKYADYVHGLIEGWWKGGTICYHGFMMKDIYDALERADKENGYVYAIEDKPKVLDNGIIKPLGDDEEHLSLKTISTPKVY